MPVIHALPSGLWDFRDAVKGKALDGNPLQIPGTLLTPDQVTKTAAMVFSPSSTLVLGARDARGNTGLTLPFIAVYATHWFFADRFNVRRANDVNLDGKPVRPALPAPPTPGLPGDGHNGNNGNNGTAGTDGQDGFSLPRFVFFAQDIFVGVPGNARPATAADIQAIFSFDGIDGGVGGVGGAGGNGTDGNQGEPGEDGDTWFGITNCAGGPGWGGRGGNAGSGGPGGYGGNGGDGANVFIFVQPGWLDRAQAINVSEDVPGFKGNGARTGNQDTADLVEQKPAPVQQIDLGQTVARAPTAGILNNNT